MYVGHLPATPEAYLGHLFVEPRKHRPGLADLTGPEAEAVGLAVRDASVALKAAGAEHVYAFVFGDRVPHLHVHLCARHPGTPSEFWGVGVTDWPDAPRGDRDTVADLVADLNAAWPDQPFGTRSHNRAT